ncbi:MAG: chromate transporter, partial [Bdellovibrionaceae bacterium]|nr:chromate transporter [Pseudobdellovibrionaceae bacterium]
NFFIISLIAIGGVSAVVPEIHRVFVEHYHLMDEQLFTQLFAISQAAPGPNVIFVGLFGWQVAGVMGAVVSLFSLCVPTLLLAVMFEKTGSQYQSKKWYNVIKLSLSPIAIGLLLSTSTLLIKKDFNWKMIVFISVIVFILSKWKLNSIYLLFIGIIVGALGLLN